MCWFVQLWMPWTVLSACLLRHVEGVDSMWLDRIDAITRLMKSLLFHAHRWVGVSRLPRGSPSTASNSTTGTTPPACVDDSDSRAALSGVDALYFMLQACSEKRTAERATSLISTAFTEVDKVSHSKCASVSSLASKYSRFTTSNLP